MCRRQIALSRYSLRWHGRPVRTGSQGDKESEPETQKPPYLIRHTSEALDVTGTGRPTVAAEPDKHAADLQA